MRLATLALAGCALVAARGSPAHAQSTVTILDSIGGRPTIGIGGDGLPILAYRTNIGLKVAHCTNAACTSATITAIDTAPDVGAYLSLAVGADGLALIAYSDEANERLKVAHCDNAACTSATLSVVENTLITGRTAIARGTDGRGLIAYSAGTAPHVAHCADAACSASVVSTIGAPICSPSCTSEFYDVALAIGSDGLGLIARVTGLSLASLEVRHCTNTACSSATLTQAAGSERASTGEPGFVGYSEPTVEIGGDGLPTITRMFNSLPFPVSTSRVLVQKCADVPCTSSTLVLERPVAPGGVEADSAIAPDGLLWIAYPYDSLTTRLLKCTSPACSAFTETCHHVRSGTVALARGSDDLPVVAFASSSGLGVMHGPGVDCSLPPPPPTMSIADAQHGEGGTIELLVTLSAPAPGPITFEAATSDGTAHQGPDFGAAQSPVTIPATQTSGRVIVPIAEDDIHEGDEDFFVTISNPSGATIVDGQARAVIWDDDPLPEVSSDGCLALEASSVCNLTVSLDHPSVLPVTVDFASANGTAQAGPDYLAVSGSLTFAPGTLQQAVTVSLVNDSTPELDEDFFVGLSNAVNATVPPPGSGRGLILDDDATSLSTIELTHGSALRNAMSAPIGPEAGSHYFRVAQSALSSYEAVVDGVSGALAPGLVLERLAEDNLTVLQTAAPVGTGTALSMAWQRREGTAELRHHLRVRSTTCSTGCGPEDAYRIRFYETTASVPRFNNSLTQITLLVLQNTLDRPLEVTTDLWGPSGALIATLPATIPARGVVLVSTQVLAPDQSGSVTLTHDGPYGALAGKAVALEPLTGYSFSSPLEPRPR